jgi:CRP-like cAMP-binding protein
MPDDNPTNLASASKLTALRQQTVFRDLDSGALDQLCRYVVSRKFRRGATIISKGDPGSSLFIVASGTVKISVTSVDGRSALLNFAGEGDMFGEIALLDGLPRTTDATANTNCELLVIDRRDFIPFIQAQPDLALKLIELLCTRLRWTTGQIEHVILQNLPGRVANALIRLADRRERAVGQSIAITQQEIGEMVGMTRESINKQLRAWESNNWIRLEHGAVHILNVAALAAFAEAEPKAGRE